MWKGIIEHYRQFLPVDKSTPIVTLNEGNTPLLHSRFLSKETGCEVYLKYEGLNPTGSFKDRGMTVAVSKAIENSSCAVICASTGNTSASAAAYAAKAGIRCIVLIPKGAIALGKLVQALIHGAKVLALQGSFDDALDVVREIANKYPITLVNSINPYRIEGQKTAAYEVCDILKDAPDFHAIPVGNAGNITAYWKGYKEYRSRGMINRLPTMLGFQAAGSAPIVKGRIIKNPKTIASAIRIGNPASWKMAEEARDESGGVIDAVTDGQILKAYELLASKEGLFIEPASAASVAGILKLAKRNYFKKRCKGKKAKIVCTLTGNGLKDPDIAIKNVKPPKIVRADLKAVLKEIGY